MKNSVISLLLVLVIMVSALATTAMAEEATVKVGYANLSDHSNFCKMVRNSIVEQCAARGWDLVCVDNNSDAQTAVKNASDLVTLGCDYVIEFNVDESVAPAIMDIFNEAGIPVIAVDIAHPGAIFFGADNTYAGTLAGETAGKWINENWNGELEYVVEITQPDAGEAVAPRVGAFPTGLSNVGITVDEANIIEIDGKNDSATQQSLFAAFLQAHPDATKIAVATIDDTAGNAVYSAAEIAGRADQVVVVSQNCTADFVEPMYACNGETNWIASIGYFPNRYGEWICPIIEKMIAGEELEENYYIDHLAIDWSNIKEYYPIDNLPWNNVD